jgi:hypothetical protein
MNKNYEIATYRKISYLLCESLTVVAFPDLTDSTYTDHVRHVAAKVKAEYDPGRKTWGAPKILVSIDDQHWTPMIDGVIAMLEKVREEMAHMETMVLYGDNASIEEWGFEHPMSIPWYPCGTLQVEHVAPGEAHSALVRSPYITCTDAAMPLWQQRAFSKAFLLPMDKSQIKTTMRGQAPSGKRKRQYVDRLLVALGSTARHQFDTMLTDAPWAGQKKTVVSILDVFPKTRRAPGDRATDVAVESAAAPNVIVFSPAAYVGDYKDVAYRGAFPETAGAAGVILEKILAVTSSGREEVKVVYCKDDEKKAEDVMNFLTAFLFTGRAPSWGCCEHMLAAAKQRGLEHPTSRSSDVAQSFETFLVTSVASGETPPEEISVKANETIREIAALGKIALNNVDRKLLAQQIGRVVDLTRTVIPGFLPENSVIEAYAGIDPLA